MEPLTHHEILGLVAPFSRAGRHLDLAASDRQQRRLVFRAVDHPASRGADGPLPALHETLQLEHPVASAFRLTRRLELEGGMQAELVCDGPDPGALLRAVQGVAPQRQVRQRAEPGGGYCQALSHRVEPDSGRLTLLEARAELQGLELAMTVSRVKNIPAEIELRPRAGMEVALPDDLLAVLGLPWSQLRRSGQGWRARVMLRGFGSERTRDAESRLGDGLEHLARTLAESPAQFHARFLRERWFVVLRRLTPLLVAMGLILAAACVPRLELGPDSVWRMLIFNAPPILLMILFTMREIPRVEIPPLPRASTAPDWRAPDRST